MLTTTIAPAGAPVKLRVFGVVTTVTVVVVTAVDVWVVVVPTVTFVTVVWVVATVVVVDAAVVVIVVLVVVNWSAVVPGGPVAVPVATVTTVEIVVVVTVVGAEWSVNAVVVKPLTVADRTSPGLSEVATCTLPLASRMDCSTVVLRISTCAWLPTDSPIIRPTRSRSGLTTNWLGSSCTPSTNT